MNTGKREGIPPSVRMKVLVRDGHRCTYCGAKAAEAPLHIDHVIPVCRGGTNEIENLVAACSACNIGKGGKMLLEPSPDDSGKYVRDAGGPAPVPAGAWAAQRACEDMTAAWLKQFRRYWNQIEVLPPAITVESVGEAVSFAPTFVCRGRESCDFGDEVRVLLTEWRSVGGFSYEEQDRIIAAVISGYEVPTMILMGPPNFFYGVAINERYKGNPLGTIVCPMLQPSDSWENRGWYPDENFDFQDLREPFFHAPSKLKLTEWDRASEQLVGVYSSCEDWGL